MGKYLLFILLFVVTIVNAQFTHDPAPITVNVAPATEEIVTDVIFSRPIDSMYTVYWKIEKDGNFDSNWEFFVCDINLCYGPLVEQCPANKPNNWINTSHLFQFHFRPHNTSGSSVITIKFYGDKNFKNEVMSSTITLNSAEPSSTREVNLYNNLKVYPNPASDYFQVANSYNVKKIVLYNIFGKEVKSFFHYNNAQHEISDIKSGIYIVKFFNSKNKVVKTLKLNKTYNGV